MAVDWHNDAGPQRALPARARNAAGPLPSLAGSSLSSAPAPDELLVERNAAIAEAALWQRRLIRMQQERDQARADLRACDKSHTEWEEAYAELLQQFRRLEVRLGHTEFERDYYRDLVGFHQAAFDAQIRLLVVD